MLFAIITKKVLNKQSFCFYLNIKYSLSRAQIKYGITPIISCFFTLSPHDIALTRDKYLYPVFFNEKKKSTELMTIKTPYFLYSAIQAILRMFKLFPEEFVSTFDEFIKTYSDKSQLLNRNYFVCATSCTFDNMFFSAHRSNFTH